MWVFAISKYIARENVQVKIYTHLLRSFFETLCCSGSAKSTPVVWNRLPSLYVRNNLITEVLPCLNGQVLKRLHTIQLLIIFFTLDLSCGVQHSCLISAVILATPVVCKGASFQILRLVSEYSTVPSRNIGAFARGHSVENPRGLPAGERVLGRGRTRSFPRADASSRVQERIPRANISTVYVVVQD